MMCFSEQPIAEEDFYTRRLQDKLRFSTLSFASTQALRNPKPALKDFSSEQFPNPKTKTRRMGRRSIHPTCTSGFFSLITPQYFRYYLFENKILKSYQGITSHVTGMLHPHVIGMLQGG